MTKFLDNTRTYFFGRSYAEIISCFGLDESKLLGKSVLDCPSGPSSFAAESNDRGFNVTALDPMFYRGFDALKTLAYSDYEAMFSKMRSKSEFFVKGTFDSIEDAEKDRYQALENFLVDFKKHFTMGRYVAGELPSLKFDDESFDIVLCGHLLFIYDFSFDFHLESVFEMCRIAKEEVRIHPVVDSSGVEHPMLNPLMKELTYRGYTVELEKVDHEFFRGSNQTLVIRK